jgi:hypothetical protein
MGYILIVDCQLESATRRGLNSDNLSLPRNAILRQRKPCRGDPGIHGSRSVTDVFP